MTRTAPPTAAVLSVTYMPHVPHTLKRLLPGIFLDQVQITYVTHQVEDGVDPKFLREQVGHRYASTLGGYTHVSEAFMNTMMRKALEQGFETAEAGSGPAGRGIG